MLFKYKFSIFSLVALLCNNHVYCTDTYLCRTAGERDDKTSRTVICEYIEDDAPVKWHDEVHNTTHTVFGKEFKNINEEIAKQKAAMNSFDCHRKDGNVLTVILAATGRSEDNQFKGYYANLRVYFDEDTQPHFKARSANKHKIATFCSESFMWTCDIAKYKKQFSLHKELNTHEPLEPECGHSRAKTHLKNCKATSGHSECRALREILKLPTDTFHKLLPSKYQVEVVFNEIHFISYWDACSQYSATGNNPFKMHGCSVDLFQAIEKIKNRFGNNLFVFYHVNHWYGKAEYSVKIHKEIKDASYNRTSRDFVIDSDDDDDDKTYEINLREQLILEDIPTFYIGR